ncbi:hypothetical protein BDD12DRAFT_936783 [Trichophaea hybrida]|nr:hypothetical protein BDD12DRAFT_936783 [Trichophaea hybrida]
MSMLHRNNPSRDYMLDIYTNKGSQRLHVQSEDEKFGLVFQETLETKKRAEGSLPQPRFPLDALIKGVYTAAFNTKTRFLGIPALFQSKTCKDFNHAFVGNIQFRKYSLIRENAIPPHMPTAKQEKPLMHCSFILANSHKQYTRWTGDNQPGYWRDIGFADRGNRPIKAEEVDEEDVGLLAQSPRSSSEPSEQKETGALVSLIILTTHALRRFRQEGHSFRTKAEFLRTYNLLPIAAQSGECFIKGGVAYPMVYPLLITTGDGLKEIGIDEFEKLVEVQRRA